MIANARHRANKKGWAFDLDDHTAPLIRRIALLRCEVSGADLIAGGRRGPYSPSLDRIDSRQGYTYSNIRVIAWGLNKFFAEWGEDAVKDLAKLWLDNQKAA